MRQSWSHRPQRQGPVRAVRGPLQRRPLPLQEQQREHQHKSEHQRTLLPLARRPPGGDHAIARTGGAHARYLVNPRDVRVERDSLCHHMLRLGPLQHCPSLRAHLSGKPALCLIVTYYSLQYFRFICLIGLWPPQIQQDHSQPRPVHTPFQRGPILGVHRDLFVPKLGQASQLTAKVHKSGFILQELSESEHILCDYHGPK